jgi:hypothetical protein
LLEAVLEPQLGRLLARRSARRVRAQLSVAPLVLELELWWVIRPNRAIKNWQSRIANSPPNSEKFNNNDANSNSNDNDGQSSAGAQD